MQLCGLEEEYLHDIWLHIKPMQTILAKSTARKEDFVSWGSIHIVTQKNAEPNVIPQAFIYFFIAITEYYEQSGLLAHNGISVSPIPLRMEVGDIILFESSDLFTQGTKIATRSQVCI